MPYIKQENREKFYPVLQNLPIIDGPGELNFLITSIINKYMGADRKEHNYQKINDVVGSLEGAKIEFYRRTATPYEDKKILENGDV